METLSRMLSAMGTGGFVTGFSEGDTSGATLNISHLLFTDDTLMFCEVEQKPNLDFAGTFTLLRSVSGLKVNLAKLELVPIGNVHNIQLLAITLGYKVPSLSLSLSMNYLRLLLGVVSRAKSIWDTVN